MRISGNPVVKDRDVSKRPQFGTMSGGMATATFLTCLALAPVSAVAAAPFALGAYIGGPNSSNAGAEATVDANFASFKSALGAAPTLIDVYTDYTQSVGYWQSNASWQAYSNSVSPVAKNLVPVVSFPMQSLAAGSPSTDQQYQLFANGQYDWVIQQVVNAWISQGFRTLIFRVGWEMNLNYQPNYAGDDSQTQSDWVAAFRHISTIMHQTANAAGVSLQVVWNPSATNYSNAEATNSLYPGDDVVDIIGIDIYAGMYPFYDGSGVQIHDWVTGGEDYSLSAFMARPYNREHYWTYPAATEWSLDGSNGHSQSFTSVMNFAIQHNKPFAVPECGSGSSDSGADVADDGAFPYWLAKTIQSGQAKGLQMSFVNIWDTNDDGNYQFSYKSDDKPRTLRNWGRFLGPLVKQ